LLVVRAIALDAVDRCAAPLVKLAQLEGAILPSFLCGDIQAVNTVGAILVVQDFTGNL